MDFGVVVNSRRVGLLFDQFPHHAHDRLLAAITRLTATLYARIEGAEPTLTGKLRRETTIKIYDDHDHIAGRVFFQRGLQKSEYGKIAALEYGAHQPTNVKAHTQRLSQVFGHSISQESVMVAAYNRQVNIAAHRFLRGPLSEMAGEIEVELRKALDEALAA